MRTVKGFQWNDGIRSIYFTQCRKCKNGLWETLPFVRKEYECNLDRVMRCFCGGAYQVTFKEGK
jgi:hypothetical protein